jgi:beta-galactosidase
MTIGTQDIKRSRDIFGAEIQYFRLEPRYWEPIIQRLKDTGLECVTTYVQWGTHLVGAADKRHPAGVLDFTGKTNPRLNLMRFLELVEKHGLNLNFRSGPFCCNEMAYGGYPAALVLGDPEMMVWDWQNRTTQGYWIGRKEGSQPSYLHPDYLAQVGHWFNEVDPIIRAHLKSRGGCVTMLNLDNEISYIVRDSLLDSDYNPVNVRPGGFYHQFLLEKYGSAAKLPYGRRFRSIDEVQPPRAVPASIGDDLAWYTDWLEFKTWCMCGYIRRLRALHEKNGVRDVTFMTNFNPHLPEGVPTRMPAFEEAVGKGGLVGYDFYRGTFMSYSGYHSMARVLKLMNASLGYTWSAEFMAGTWNKVLQTRVSDDHMRFMARGALAQGCKAIDWFMFHDRDCWGDSPVGSHGHPRPSLQVLKETMGLLFGKIKAWDSLVPQTDVGIVYDLVQHQHTAVGDPMPCDDNNQHVGKPEIDGVPAGRASQEYYGLFRLVEQAGCQPGVVDILAKPERAKAFPVLFMPGSPVVEMAASRALRAYVSRGGVLVLSGAWPSRNERGGAVRFLGLGKPRGGKPVVEVKVGKGRLVWHRDWLAQEKAEEESLESLAAVKRLIGRYGGEAAVRVEPETEVSWVDWSGKGGHMEYRQPRNLGSAVLHRGAGESILFVLNHYPEAARFRLAFGQGLAPARLVDLDTDEVVPVKNGKAVVDVDRKAAAVYRVE